MNAKQVIDLFVERGTIDPSQVDDIVREITGTGRSVLEVLVDFGFLNEEQFYRAVADSLGTDYVDLKDFDPTPDVLQSCRPASHGCTGRFRSG